MSGSKIIPKLCGRSSESEIAGEEEGGQQDEGDEGEGGERGDGLQLRHVVNTHLHCSHYSAAVIKQISNAG